ncbi:MAG: tRNA lysidine(34) synthetase TilS [Pseudomonadota bacterium]|nr:tRNA lysidine(34) synthetase TilS [Pseudomonadota bacterium]
MTGASFSDSDIDVLLRPLAGQEAVALAVSGGSDSMALMHLAARWHARASGRSTGLTVLSVDHGLRPEAPAEAQHVARVARSLGLKAAVLRWEGAKPGTGIQAAARIARYDLMAGYAHAHGIGAIVTAHHLEDQAETLVMRLARGSGVDGLGGISDSIAWAGIAVLRPLLTVPKARLRAYAQSERIKWVEDPSNENPHFERVRVRAALDELEKLGVTRAALARTARRMARAREALDATAGDFFSAHVSVSPLGYCTLDRDALGMLPEEIALRAMARALTGVGGGSAPVGAAKLEALADRLRDGSAVVRTLAGCRIDAAQARITLTREPGRAGLDEMRLRPGDSVLWDRRFTMSLSHEAEGTATVRALGHRGLGLVRAQCGRPIAIPGRVAAGLAAFWQGEEVISVPALGFSACGTGAGSACFRSEFVALAPLCRH